MTWEYLNIVCANSYEVNKELNKLGKKGWEAYSVIRIAYAFGDTYIAYLKRPKRKKCHKARHKGKMPATSLN